MTQSSMLWDGLALGDAAVLANYTAIEFCAMLRRFMAGSGDEAFVIPGYLNDLRPITSVTANTMTIKSGAALVNGYLYIADADVDLTFSSVGGAGEARIDVIVLEIDFTAQTVRLAVVEGTRAAQPTFPSLTQDSSTWQVALAYCYLPTGYSNIAEGDIHDIRQFAPTPEVFLLGGKTNLLSNPEFGVFSEATGSPLSSTNPPDRWTEVGTCSYEHADKSSDHQTRGRAITLVAGANNSGISQTIPVKVSTLYTIKLYYKNPLTTDSMTVTVTDDGGTPVSISRDLLRYNEWVEETIRLTTASDATELTVSVVADISGDEPILGQVIVVEGYLPGTFRPKREYIPFDASTLIAADINAIFSYDDNQTINGANLFTTALGFFNEAVALRFYSDIVSLTGLGEYTEMGVGPGGDGYLGSTNGFLYGQFRTDWNEAGKNLSQPFYCAFESDTNTGEVEIEVDPTDTPPDIDTDTTLNAIGVFT